MRQKDVKKVAKKYVNFIGLRCQHTWRFMLTYLALDVDILLRGGSVEWRTGAAEGTFAEKNVVRGSPLRLLNESSMIPQ